MSDLVFGRLAVLWGGIERFAVWLEGVRDNHDIEMLLSNKNSPRVFAEE